ncbi:MAG TPA: phospholipase D-like domain-containing protein [Tepidisphaeraceae bacterium]|jgi:cardiolipin synthase
MIAAVELVERNLAGTRNVKAAPLRAAPHVPATPAAENHGINTCVGSDDDGWCAPPPVTLSDGTRLQLFKDGEALLAAYDAIKGAQRVIFLEVYIFASDDTGWAFADLLCEKAKQGVRVFAIYDSFGSIDTDRKLFRKMRQAGVRVQEFNPIRPWECNYSWRPLNRDHRKLLVIDRRIAGIGGLNIGAEYGGGWVVRRKSRRCEAWRDNGVGIVGPGAAMFAESFIRTWRFITHGGRIRRAEYSAHLEDADLGLLASVPTLNSPLRPSLCRLMRGARKSIDMTMAYFAPDDELVEELCRAARRGMRVRLMLPGRCDVPLVSIAARSFYETLMSCGIEVYERQGVVLHAKTMVLDGNVTLMGSTNLDYRSIEFNCEISAIIRSPQFGAQMRGVFEHDIHFAKKIDLPEWRRRPTWDRFVQWAVSRARYLL